MNKSQPENEVDTGLKPDQKPEKVPDGNKDVFSVLLKPACHLPASVPKGEASRP